MKKAKIPANTGASKRVIIKYWVLVNFDLTSLLKKIENCFNIPGILKILSEFSFFHFR